MSGDADGKFLKRLTISLGCAQSIVAAAFAEAEKSDLRVSVAVVDDGGNLLTFARMDHIHIGTVEVSIAKARTALSFKRRTGELDKALTDGALGVLSIPGLLALDGGLPILNGTMVVGAIGVSGARPDQDAAIAAAGAAVAATA